MEVMRNNMRLLDPQGMMNPGKLILDMPPVQQNADEVKKSA